MLHTAQSPDFQFLILAANKHSHASTLMSPWSVCVPPNLFRLVLVLVAAAATIAMDNTCMEPETDTGSTPCSRKLSKGNSFVQSAFARERKLLSLTEDMTLEEFTKHKKSGERINAQDPHVGINGSYGDLSTKNKHNQSLSRLATKPQGSNHGFTSATAKGQFTAAAAQSGEQVAALAALGHKLPTTELAAVALKTKEAEKEMAAAAAAQVEAPVAAATKLANSENLSSLMQPSSSMLHQYGGRISSFRGPGLLVLVAALVIVGIVGAVAVLTMRSMSSGHAFN